MDKNEGIWNWFKERFEGVVDEIIAGVVIAVMGSIGYLLVQWMLMLIASPMLINVILGFIFVALVILAAKIWQGRRRLGIERPNATGGGDAKQSKSNQTKNFFKTAIPIASILLACGAITTQVFTPELRCIILHDCSRQLPMPLATKTPSYTFTPAYVPVTTPTSNPTIIQSPTWTRTISSVPTSPILTSTPIHTIFITPAPQTPRSIFTSTTPAGGSSGIRITNYIGSPVSITINNNKHQIDLNTKDQYEIPLVPGRYTYSINVLASGGGAKQGEVTITTGQWVYWGLSLPLR